MLLSFILFIFSFIIIADAYRKMLAKIVNVYE